MRRNRSDFGDHGQISLRRSLFMLKCSVSGCHRDGSFLKPPIAASLRALMALGRRLWFYFSARCSCYPSVVTLHLVPEASDAT